MATIEQLKELAEEIRTNTAAASNTNEKVGSTLKGITEHLEDVEGDVDEHSGDITELQGTVEEHTIGISGLGTRMTTAEGDIDAVEAVLGAADAAPVEGSGHLVLSGGVKSALQTLEDTLRSNGYRIAGFIGPDNSYLAKAVEGTCYFITNPVAASWYGSHVAGRVYLQPGTTQYSNPPSSVTGWTQYDITGACIVGYKGGAWNLHNLPFTLLTQADELQTAINRLALNLFEELTGYRVDDGSVDSEGKRGRGSDYGHGVLAVTPGQMFAIENYQNVDTVRYAFATVETCDATADIPKVGWGTVTHGTRQVITIPDGCTFLWWNVRGYQSRLYGVDNSKLVSLIEATKKTCYTSGATYTDNSIVFGENVALWWKNQEQGNPLHIEPNETYTFSSTNAALVLRGSGNNPSDYTLLQCASSAVLPSDIVLLYWSSSKGLFVSGALYAEYIGYKAGSSIEGIDDRIDDVEKSAAGLKWIPCPMVKNYRIHFYGTQIRQTSSGSYSSFFIPVVEGEWIRIVKVAAATGGENKASYYAFSTFVPGDDLVFHPSFDSYKTVAAGTGNVGTEIVIKAPYNGFLSVCTRESYYCDLAVFKSENVNIPSQYTPDTMLIDLSETTKQRFLQTLESATDYGDLVTISTDTIRVSDYIDVSGFAYIGVPIALITINTLRNVAESFAAGAIWYDANKDPICTACNQYSFLSSTWTSGMKLLKRPSGAAYIRITLYVANGATEAFMRLYRANDAIGRGGVEQYVGGMVAGAVTDVLEERSMTISTKSIFELNTDTDMLPKMAMLNKHKNKGGQKEYAAAPVVFAHISDIHGVRAQYERFLSFANHWKEKGYVREIIDTGDVVLGTYGDSISWRDALQGVGDVITIIGNHDTRASNAEKDAKEADLGRDLTSNEEWQYHSHLSITDGNRKDAYNRYMVGPNSEHPYISNWGVTQPTNAAGNGLCYYYKDYLNDVSSDDGDVAAGLRMICLDAMGYDSAQDAWLQTTLSDARTNNLHVCILVHFPGGLMEPVKCDYTSLVLSGDNISTQTTYNNYLYDSDNNRPRIAHAVDVFQDDGGIFAGYLIGHWHRDMVNTIVGYPKQLVYAVDSGGRPNNWDTTKVDGCKLYDSFQLVSINTVDKTVRLVKVGADMDYYMRRKETLCVSYDIVTTKNNVSRAKGIIGAKEEHEPLLLNLSSSGGTLSETQFTAATSDDELRDAWVTIDNSVKFQVTSYGYNATQSIFFICGIDYNTMTVYKVGVLTNKNYTITAVAL